MSPSSTLISPLSFADGSANYSSRHGDQILASVNGPMDVPRRDTQKPDEATLEVWVKPGVGTSGVGERYIEGVIKGVLKRIVLSHEKYMARRGIVITLVVLANKGGEGKVAGRGASVGVSE